MVRFLLCCSAIHFQVRYFGISLIMINHINIQASIICHQKCAIVYKMSRFSLANIVRDCIRHKTRLILYLNHKYVLLENHKSPTCSNDYSEDLSRGHSELQQESGDQGCADHSYNAVNVQKRKKKCCSDSWQNVLFQCEIQGKSHIYLAN